MIEKETEDDCDIREILSSHSFRHVIVLFCNLKSIHNYFDGLGDLDLLKRNCYVDHPKIFLETLDNDGFFLRHGWASYFIFTSGSPERIISTAMREVAQFCEHNEWPILWQNETIKIAETEETLDKMDHLFAHVHSDNIP